MGRRKGKLRELGLKRVPKKFWVNTGFGTGHYVYRAPVTQSDGSLVRVCEDKYGEMWEVPLKQPSLNDMGLKRNEYGKIVPK